MTKKEILKDLNYIIIAPVHKVPKLVQQVAVPQLSSSRECIATTMANNAISSDLIITVKSIIINSGSYETK